MWTADRILAVLDACCDAYRFPVLENGYVYLAATRLSLHRSECDWALAIEVFGFSPRAGLPDVHVYTFGSRLQARIGPKDYVSREAYESHLRLHPHDEARFFYPIAEGAWQDSENAELVAEDAVHVELRGVAVPIPSRDVFSARGIDLAEAPRIQTFELCRLLADTHRDDVLATPDERRASVPPELHEIMVLDEWHHPNVIDDRDRPSSSECFQQLARVLVIGDVSAYRPSAAPNTHWLNWPDGGTL